MSTTPHAIASAEETARVLEQIEGMLNSLNENLARLALAGELNLQQSERLSFALFIAGGLQKLFAEQSVRYGGPPIATSRRES